MAVALLSHALAVNLQMVPLVHSLEMPNHRLLVSLVLVPGLQQELQEMEVVVQKRQLFQALLLQWQSHLLLLSSKEA